MDFTLENEFTHKETKLHGTLDKSRTDERSSERDESDADYVEESSDHSENCYDEEDDDLFSSDDELREVIQKMRNDKEIESMNENQEVGLLGMGGYQSEYDDSDTSQASIDTDEEADFVKRTKHKKNQVYDERCDHKKLKFEVGFKFKDYDECKEGVRMWAIVNGHNIRWKQSGGGKLEAVCVDGCPWRLYASRLHGEPTCVVKSYVGEHNCLRAIYNRQATSGWVSRVIIPMLKRNKTYSLKDMRKDIQLTYDIIVSKTTCYRGKKKAMEKLRGTYESHYSKLRSYISYLREMDRAGRFELKTYLDGKDRPIFQRCYIGFSALKRGFMVGCRRVIGFDACFLKTVLGGAILTAVGKDCNYKMYPIAWAVVEKENEETWTWFFEKLFEDFNIMDGNGWTFMSDKQKGLINGIQKLVPNAEHRHCARHVYANWKKIHNGEKFKCLFWQSVMCTSRTQFQKTTEEMKHLSLAAYDDFFQRQPTSFCKSLVSLQPKSDVIDNNICETFNSYIVNFRDKPLIDMLEDMRINLMRRIHDIAKDLHNSIDNLCPNVRKKIEKIQSHVKNYDLFPALDSQYEVHSLINPDEICVVNLGCRECTCRWWNLTGIPCVHALTCIVHLRSDLVMYVDKFYYRSNGIEAYRHGLSPMGGPLDWPTVSEAPIFPPEVMKLPGRPKKNRIRDPSERSEQIKKKWVKNGIKMSCRNCGRFGHNSRTCPEPHVPTVESMPKRKVGRPRKNEESSLGQQLRRKVGRPRKNAQSSVSGLLQNGRQRINTGEPRQNSQISQVDNTDGRNIDQTEV